MCKVTFTRECPFIPETLLVTQQRLRLSNRQMAKKIGIHEATYGRIVKGEITISEDIVKKIEKALNVKLIKY